MNRWIQNKHIACTNAVSFLNTFFLVQSFTLTSLIKLIEKTMVINISGKKAFLLRNALLQTGFCRLWALDETVWATLSITNKQWQHIYQQLCLLYSPHLWIKLSNSACPPALSYNTIPRIYTFPRHFCAPPSPFFPASYTTA